MTTPRLDRDAPMKATERSCTPDGVDRTHDSAGDAVNERRTPTSATRSAALPASLAHRRTAVLIRFSHSRARARILRSSSKSSADSNGKFHKLPPTLERAMRTNDASSTQGRTPHTRLRLAVVYRRLHILAEPRTTFHFSMTACSTAAAPDVNGRPVKKSQIQYTYGAVVRNEKYLSNLNPSSASSPSPDISLTTIKVVERVINFAVRVAFSFD